MTDETPFIKRKIITYLILAFGLSSVFYYFIISAGSLHKPGEPPWTMMLMWSPGVAAILTALIYQRHLRGFGWGWGKTKYQGVSYILPFLYGLIAYGIVWMTGLGGFPDAGYVARNTKQAMEVFGILELSPAGAITIAVLMDGTIGVLFSCFSALGEEIGWRGFLVPHLAKLTSFRKTALISGAIWSVYHYPVLLFADYNSGAPWWFSLSCFTALVFGAGFVFAWLRLRSGSLWTGVILHASHNLFVQGVFDPITSDTGLTKYFIGEFGVMLPIVIFVMIWIFRKKEDELTPAMTVS